MNNSFDLLYFFVWFGDVGFHRVILCNICYWLAKYNIMHYKYIFYEWQEEQMLFAMTILKYLTFLKHIFQ